MIGKLPEFGDYCQHRHGSPIGLVVDINGNRIMVAWNNQNKYYEGCYDRRWWVKIVFDTTKDLRI
jgi:hypothetical protein